MMYKLKLLASLSRQFLGSRHTANHINLMGISGKATGGGGAVWPRLEIVKQTIRIAQLGGPLRLRLGSDASPNGDGGTGNGAALVPRVASPGYHPFRVAIDASIW